MHNKRHDTYKIAVRNLAKSEIIIVIVPNISKLLFFSYSLIPSIIICPLPNLFPNKYFGPCKRAWLRCRGNQSLWRTNIRAKGCGGNLSVGILFWGRTPRIIHILIPSLKAPLNGDLEGGLIIWEGSGTWLPHRRRGVCVDWHLIQGLPVACDIQPEGSIWKLVHCEQLYDNRCPSSVMLTTSKRSLSAKLDKDSCQSFCPECY